MGKYYLTSTFNKGVFLGEGGWSEEGGGEGLLNQSDGKKWDNH